MPILILKPGYPFRYPFLGGTANGRAMDGHLGQQGGGSGVMPEVC
jgi:hypothetical protein